MKFKLADSCQTLQPMNSFVVDEYIFPRAQVVRCRFFQLPTNICVLGVCCLFSFILLDGASMNSAMPSTKNYCVGGLWVKKTFPSDVDSVIVDFRERLKVKTETTEEMNCAEMSGCELSASDEETECNIRAFICPTADPLRTSSSPSYDVLFELLERGTLIKEAVRRLKSSRRSKQLKRLDRSR